VTPNEIDREGDLRHALRELRVVISAEFTYAVAQVRARNAGLPCPSREHFAGQDAFRRVVRDNLSMDLAGTILFLTVLALRGSHPRELQRSTLN